MSAQWIGLIIGAYVLGSIPFGVIIGRFKGIDIREHGSRNIGATNVTRVLGRKAGVSCFVLDVGKGVGPVIAAGIIFDLLGRPAGAETGLTSTQMWLWMAVACASVFGHMHSIFLGFGGGKGVATGFGSMAAMWPLLTFPALGAMVVWYGVLRFTRYISVASMLAALSLPVGYILSALPRDALEQPLSHSLDHIVAGYPPLIVTALMALVVVFKHRANIARLRRGEEPKSKRH